MNEFNQSYKNLSGGLNQALNATDIDSSQSPFHLNISFSKSIGSLSKRYGNHRLGSTTTGAGSIYGLFEHNDNVGGYTKLRVTTGGHLEKLSGSTWSVSDSAEFTTGLLTDAINFSISGTPRVYIVNGTDTVRYTDATGVCSTLGTLTGSGRRIKVAQGRMFMAGFTSAAKANRFEWTKTFTDQFYKDGESYATSTNYELLDEPITCLDVLDDIPIIFGRNGVYYWDIVGSAKTKISTRGTASLYGAAVIPDANILVYAGVDNIYAFRFGQKNATPIGNRTISGTGIGVYELISNANKSQIKVGAEGYKVYFAIGDVTIPDYDEDGGLTISDACIEYDAQLDTFGLHSNFNVNVFRRLTDTSEQLYYGSSDTMTTYGVEDGTDFNDQDSTGASVAIDGRFRLHANEAQNPNTGKVFRTLKLRISTQNVTSKYLTLYWGKNEEPPTLLADGTNVTNTQRIGLPQNTDLKWEDRFFDFPRNISLFSMGLEFRNNDLGTNMPIREITVVGNFTTDSYKELVND